MNAQNIDFQTPEQLANWIVRGNQDAYNFLIVVTNVLHFWDDLIDKDKPLSKDEIHSRMWDALVTLPRNKFYRTYFDELQPVLNCAIANWMAANQFEAGEQKADLDIAFIIRSDYANLAIHSALLIGGEGWAATVAPHVRRFWHREGREEYERALRAEKAAANPDPHPDIVEG